MKVFMTGATGYIGSAVAEALAQAGHDVVALARSDASERGLAARGYDVHRGDLAQPEGFAAAAAAADAVIHAAAVDGADQGDVDRAAAAAILGEMAGSGKPFLYTSGVWVLGPGGAEPFSDDAPANPIPLVAWRAEVERVVVDAAGRGVRTVVVRPGIVYGRGGGIPAMMKAWGEERGAVPYVVGPGKGSGANAWPFVHVEALAELYVRALDAPAGTVLNAAHGPAVRVRALAEAASHAAGVPGRTAPWPLQEAREQLGGFADALALDQRLDAARARRLLGWDPAAQGDLPGVLDDVRAGSYVDRPGVHAAYLCATCGTQFAPTDGPPEACPVCADERQYVPAGGQRWTTMDELRRTHRNVIRTLEPGLVGIGTEPAFAIGQRALLVRTPAGNVLWDCVALLDDETVEAVRRLGGVDAVAISHPHYYTSMVEWSRAFGGVPIYLHEADRAWVMRPDESIVYWSGETRALGGGVTLVRTGGHFDGSAVLHWSAGAGGRGALLTGDSMKVAMDRRHVSFMYSYPNHVPLSAAEVRRVAGAVEPFDFDRIYGAWFDHVVATGGKAAVRRSAERYVRALDLPAREAAVS